MADFCKDQHVFFNDDDRIKFQIAQSKNHFKEFKNAFNRAFEKVHTADDHPELTKLLTEDVKGGGEDDDETGRSGLGLSKKSNRSSKSGKKIPKSFTIDIPKDKMPKTTMSP